MKKLLIFAVILLALSSSVFGSTLIYKGTITRKDPLDYSPSELIAVPERFQQIRIVVVRTAAGPSVHPSKSFAVSVESDFEGVTFDLAHALAPASSVSLLIDTPPSTISVITRNQVGTFAVFVWGS